MSSSVCSMEIPPGFEEGEIVINTNDIQSQNIEQPKPLPKKEGIYIPPQKRASMITDASDKTSVEFQKQAWEALKKSLIGLLNKVNVHNIRDLVLDLFTENLIRGRGLFARTFLQTQTASPTSTNIYVSLLSIVNSKLPMVGQLVINRAIIQFRRAFKRCDKPACIALTKLFAHLVNQKVVEDFLGFQLATLLLDKPTEDSVELCVSFFKECGKYLFEVSPKGGEAIVNRMRSILHEGEVDDRVQYSIESALEVFRHDFENYPTVLPELQLTGEDDVITHKADLMNMELNGEVALDFFQAVSPEQYANEDEKWKQMSAILRGEDSDDEDEGEVTSSESSDEDSSSDSELEALKKTDEKSKTFEIQDATESEIVHLRRNVYLICMSSLSAEECTHKLRKLNIRPFLHREVIAMLCDYSSRQRLFQQFPAIATELLARLERNYIPHIIDVLQETYETIHRLETNRIRNTAQFFAYLLAKDAIPWTCMKFFRISEDQTTSAQRIFIKILLQELTADMTLAKLQNRFEQPDLEPYLSAGLLPHATILEARYAIKFFAAIGLDPLTSQLKDILRQMLLPPPRPHGDLTERRDSSQIRRRASSSSESSSSMRRPSSPAGRRRRSPSSHSSSSSRSFRGRRSDSRERRRRHGSSELSDSSVEHRRRGSSRFAFPPRGRQEDYRGDTIVKQEVRGDSVERVRSRGREERRYRSPSLSSQPSPRKASRRRERSRSLSSEDSRRPPRRRYRSSSRSLSPPRDRRRLVVRRRDRSLSVTSSSSLYDTKRSRRPVRRGRSHSRSPPRRHFSSDSETDGRVRRRRQSSRSRSRSNSKLASYDRNGPQRRVPRENRRSLSPSPPRNEARRNIEPSPRRSYHHRDRSLSRSESRPRRRDRSASFSPSGRSSAVKRRRELSPIAGSKKAKVERTDFN